jgi:hypothetical protein
VDQLFDLTPVPAPEPATPPRRSSKGIAPGDIVEVDRKGRRFHAHVLVVEQRDTGFHDLQVRPIDRGISYRTATIHEVVGVWRRSDPA